MRVIEALAISAITHLGILSIPGGQFSLESAPDHPQNSGVLQVELNRGNKMAANESSPAMAATTADEFSEHQGTGSYSSSIGIPLPYYYGPREVSERARPINEIDLEKSAPGGLPSEGKLILVLWINESGLVDRVEIESSRLAGEMGNAISDQFLHAAFAPAMLDGKAVKSRMKIEVVIRPPTAYVIPPPQSKPASATEN